MKAATPATLEPPGHRFSRGAVAPHRTRPRRPCGRPDVAEALDAARTRDGQAGFIGCSVNLQRWRRLHPDEFGVPVGVFLDDSLPGDA